MIAITFATYKTNNILSKKPVITTKIQVIHVPTNCIVVEVLDFDIIRDFNIEFSFPKFRQPTERIFMAIFDFYNEII